MNALAFEPLFDARIDYGAGHSPVDFGQINIDFYQSPFREQDFRRVIKEMEKSEPPKVKINRKKSKKTGLVEGDYVQFL
jgi:hypothetical protein